MLFGKLCEAACLQRRLEIVFAALDFDSGHVRRACEPRLLRGLVGRRSALEGAAQFVAAHSVDLCRDWVCGRLNGLQTTTAPAEAFRVSVGIAGHYCSNR